MQPSRRHRASIVNSMAIDATSVVRTAGQPSTKMNLRNWTNVDENMFRWALHGIHDLDTQAGFFRNDFLESDFASSLISLLSGADQLIKQSLINLHTEAISQKLQRSGYCASILVKPEVNVAADNLASLVADGKIPASAVISGYQGFAMKLATCEEHDELFQRLDPVRILAVVKIMEVLTELEPNEPVSMELTCSPYFKGASERLCKFAERRFGRKEERLDLFLAAAAYLKGFERCVCDILAACALQKLSKEPEPAIPLSESRWTNDEVLTSMAADVQPPIYILGSFDQRITIYNEQVRALRLSRALIEESIAFQGRDICVVGGGVAGVTTALALASKGCDVTLFEKAAEVIGVQESCFHRFVHPHAFSWPLAGSIRKDAGLPILDWSAESADKVALAMRKSVKFQEERLANLRIKRNAEVTEITSSDRKTTVKFELKAASKKREERYDIAIVAIGFGDDSFNAGDITTESYWTPDSLEKVTKGSVLISGTGDGGLIDTLRACIKDFDHRELIESFCSDPDLVKIGEQISAIDEKSRQAKKRGRSFNLWEEYDELEIPEKLLSKIKCRKKKHLTIYLNHKSSDVLSLNAAVFNKALTLCFIKAGGISPVQGELTNVLRNGDMLKATIINGEQARELELEALVVRHGPRVKSYFKEFVGETLWVHCEPIAGAITNLRITDQLDHQTDAFFSSEKY